MHGWAAHSTSEKKIRANQGQGTEDSSKEREMKNKSPFRIEVNQVRVFNWMSEIKSP